MLRWRQMANDADAVERSFEEILGIGQTAYQSFLVARSAVTGATLALDGDIQSCALDEAVYHETLVQPAALLHPGPKTALVMGGGEGAVLRELVKHRGLERIVMVDIDEAFVGLCRTHIPGWSAGAFDDPRVELRFEDIIAYLDREAGRTAFDLVIGDLVDVTAAPDTPFYGPSFYARLKGVLAEGAILSTQAGPAAPWTAAVVGDVLAALRGRFAEARLLTTGVPSFYGLWGFALAGASAGAIGPGRAKFGDLVGFFEARLAERGVELAMTDAATLAAAFAPPPWMGSVADLAAGDAS